MNAFVERLNGTIRREALDHFFLLSEKQVRNIISEFVASLLPFKCLRIKKITHGGSARL
jgi:hypothetical protein